MLIEMTHHAQEQAAKRNFSEDDIDFILQYGSWQRVGGAIFYHLRRKDFPKGTLAHSHWSRLEDAIVVICRCGQVLLTMYHARNPKDHHQKRKASRGDCGCPYCDTRESA